MFSQVPKFDSLRAHSIFRLRLLTGFDVKVCVFRYLRTLFRSCRSFDDSLPLFSSVYGLFLQNTGGGGMSASARLRIPTSNPIRSSLFFTRSARFAHSVINFMLCDLEAAQR